MGAQRIISKTIITTVIKPCTWRALYISRSAFLPLLCSDSHTNSGSYERQVQRVSAWCHFAFHPCTHSTPLKSLHFIFLLINLLNHQLTCNLQKKLKAFLSREHSWNKHFPSPGKKHSVGGAWQLESDFWSHLGSAAEQLMQPWSNSLTLPASVFPSIKQGS